MVTYLVVKTAPRSAAPAAGREGAARPSEVMCVEAPGWSDELAGNGERGGLVLPVSLIKSEAE